LPAPDVLNAGRVGRPHGLDGSFHVTRPRPGLLPLGGEVLVGEAAREIVRRAGTDDRPILRLVGVDDRAGAEALRGADLFVARSAAPALGEGEYWAEDLRGCRVVTAVGRELGVVDDLRALPSCEVLEVGELLVPMVGDAVIAVDVSARRIVVDAHFLGLADGAGSADGARSADGVDTADGAASAGTAGSADGAGSAGGAGTACSAGSADGAGSAGGAGTAPDSAQG
jgi:16S rRNA processing protein RimM